MAGRLAWIVAGGAAIVGGMVFQDDWFKFESREHDRVVQEAIADAKADKAGFVSARIVDGNGRRIEAEPEEVKALTDAVAMLVKAEAALAIAEMGSSPEPGEVEAARAQRDAARAQVDTLKAQVQARKNAAETQDAVKERVRQEVHEAVRGS